MIAKLTGTIDSSGQNWLVLDVAGVGYLVHCSSRTLAQLEGQDGAISLLIHTLSREHQSRLYGFYDPVERMWFRLLLTVQGVGGKVALALLGALSSSELADAIEGQDRAALCRSGGVGPKLAGRILSELSDKARPFFKTAMPTAGPRQDFEDAAAAMVRMGYRTVEVRRALAAVRRKLGDGLTLSELVRQCLQELCPHEEMP